MAHETIKQKTHNSVDKIINHAESVKDRSKEVLVGLKEKGIKIRKNVDDYIKKNPEKSVLIAAGVGAVAGATMAAVMLRKRH